MWRIVLLVFIISVSCKEKKLECPEQQECPKLATEFYQGEIDLRDKQILDISQELIMMHESLEACKSQVDSWMQSYNDKQCYCANYGVQGE